MKVALSKNKTIEWDEENYGCLLQAVSSLVPGGKIYVGGLGEATITEYDPYGIIAHLVHEEDGTVSWQLLVDEHSDTVIVDVTVIPDNPLIEPSPFANTIFNESDEVVHMKFFVKGHELGEVTAIPGKRVDIPWEKYDEIIIV